jgi:hypothetical protein
MKNTHKAKNHDVQIFWNSILISKDLKHVTIFYLHGFSQQNTLNKNLNGLQPCKHET